MSLTNPSSSSGPLTTAASSRPTAATVSQSLSLKKSLQAAVDGNASYYYLLL
jgi:cyclin-dependent kinase 8/11